MQKKMVIILLSKIIILASGCFFLIGGFNYLVDPLQFYRKAAYLKPVFYNQERYQNPGLARNFDYDTVVVGTSMSQNFSPAYVGDKFGGKAVKLAIEGSSTREQNLILKVALKSGKVKNVIWEINYDSLSGKPGAVRDADAAFPFHLYDRSILNDYKYLMDPNTTRMSFKVLNRNAKGEVKDAAEAFETMNNWNNWNTYGKEKVLNKFISDYKADLYDKSSEVINAFSWDNLKGGVDENLVSIVKEYTETKFYFYFPPYSILGQKSFQLKGILDMELTIKKYIFEELQPLSNARLYDFQSVEDIICDLSHYKDKTHYNESINNLIVDSIASNSYIVNSQNIDRNLDTLDKMVQNLSMDEILSGAAFEG